MTMQTYLNLLQHILDNGGDKGDRTGTGTRSVFGHQMRFDLSNGFPLLTTKKVHFRSIVIELLWFLKGDTNVQYLKDNKVTIWDEWSTAEQTARFGRPEGELGPVYGHQWRTWDAQLGYVDQIEEVLDSMHFNPTSRRHIVSAWNADRINVMALPPCHAMFQFYINNGELSCQLYQRSADMFLGVPFNIASYSLLVHMFAQILDLTPKEFIWTGGDCHIYNNHMEQVKQQIDRTPTVGPKLEMPEFNSLPELLTKKTNEFVLTDYNPMDSIKAPMAV